MKAKNKVTSAQVARRADVSQSAVSRTFTPGASVSPGTRQRVMDAAKELGNRPNAIARSLISGRSRMIGLVAAYLDNQFYPSYWNALPERCRAGITIRCYSFPNPEIRIASWKNCWHIRVDAAVMVSATLSSALARECP